MSSISGLFAVIFLVLGIGFLVVFLTIGFVKIIERKPEAMMPMLGGIVVTLFTLAYLIGG